MTGILTTRGMRRVGRKRDRKYGLLKMLNKKKKRPVLLNLQRMQQDISI